MKQCAECCTEKPLLDFPRDRSRKDGRLCRCRTCDNARSRRYYEKNAAKVIARVLARRPLAAPRICMHCDQLATSSQHWFCDACRAAGARRKKQPQQPPRPFFVAHRPSPKVKCDADWETKERWIQDYLQWSREVGQPQGQGVA